MNIKFVHIRPILFDNFGAQEIKPKGGMTLAYTVDGHILKVSTAVTSKRDVYCKAKGRLFAADRLNKDKYVLMPIPKRYMRRPGAFLRDVFKYAVE